MIELMQINCYVHDIAGLHCWIYCLDKKRPSINTDGYVHTNMAKKMIRIQTLSISFLPPSPPAWGSEA